MKPNKEAKMTKQYRSICMLNVSFKIFTKVIADRISMVASKVARPSQTAFIPRCYIMEGAVILHESLYELQRRKLSG